MNNKTIEIGKRTNKTNDNPFGWEKCHSISPTEIAVLYLGGENANSDALANGYAKTIKDEILSEANICDVNVYAIKYNLDDSQLKKERNQAFEDASNLENNIPQYIEDIYQASLSNRIKDSNGNRLASDDAAKNIRKLSIIAHCHGGLVALKLEKLLNKEMNRLGYNAKEISTIQKQLAIVAHAPACPLGKSDAKYISFVSANDLELPQEKNRIANFISKKLELERLNPDNKFEIKPSYISKMNDCFLIKERFEDDNYKFLGMEHNYVGFCSDGMSKDGKLLTAISKNIIANIIKNSTEQTEKNKPLPELSDLILPNKPQHKEKATALWNKLNQNGNELYKSIENRINIFALTQKGR